MIIFVRSVTAASIFAGSGAKSGYVSTMTGVPPVRFVRCSYMTKYGSSTITSSPGCTSTRNASVSAPDTPEVIR